jgi:hypothetical protein
MTTKGKGAGLTLRLHSPSAMLGAGRARGRYMGKEKEARNDSNSQINFPD